MKYNKDEKKLTFEMKSPGDAWMDHVEKNHNASAANPVTVETSNKKLTDLEKRLDEMKKSQDQKPADQQKDADISKDNTNKHKKPEREHD